MKHQNWDVKCDCASISETIRNDISDHLAFFVATHVKKIPFRSKDERWKMIWTWIGDFIGFWCDIWYNNDYLSKILLIWCISLFWVYDLHCKQLFVYFWVEYSTFLCYLLDFCRWWSNKSIQCSMVFIKPFEAISFDNFSLKKIYSH